MQLDALAAATVTRVFVESGSGVGPRPELQKALAALIPGDILVVWKLDRIARSLSDLLRVLDRVRSAQASIRSLTEPIDTSTPIGEFTIQILGAVAQLERSIIRERVVAGQRAAKARGQTWGNRPHLAPEREFDLVERFSDGGYTLKSISAAFGVSESVSRRVIGKRFPPSMFSRPGRPKKCA